MESMLIPEESNDSIRTNNIYWARRIGRECFKEKDILFNFYIDDDGFGRDSVMWKVWITIPGLPYNSFHINYIFATA